MLDEKILKNIKIKDFSNINATEAFFHYTSINNLNGIINKGLEPRVGNNSKGVEVNEKVFFSVGVKGVLVLMDAWLKWIILRPSNNFVYRCGLFYMKKNYFPKFVVDMIFSNWIKNKNRIKKACKDLKRILDDSVFLILDLKEYVDFDYNDIDELKNQNFSRKQLKYIYSYIENIEDSKMEYWNMHTYVGKVIDKSKITLLKFNENFCASNILNHMIKDNIEYIKQNFPFLCEYYNYVIQL